MHHQAARFRHEKAHPDRDGRASSGSACAVGPNYRSPVTAPAVLQNAQTSGFVARSPEEVWWREFDDPGARRFGTPGSCRQSRSALRIRPGAGSPRRFRRKKLRLCAARPAAGRFSHVDQQQPGFGTARFLSRATASASTPRGSSICSAMFAARSRPRAPISASSRRDLRGAQVTVAAEVARNYFELRGTQTRLAVARRNLE